MRALLRTTREGDGKPKNGHPHGEAFRGVKRLLVMYPSGINIALHALSGVTLRPPMSLPRDSPVHRLCTLLVTQTRAR